MRRAQVYVDAIDPDGKPGYADVMDLTDESFRVLVVSALVRAGALVGLKDEFAGEPIPVRALKVLAKGQAAKKSSMSVNLVKPLGA